MDKKLSFAVVGGDMRQAHLAELLAEDGHDVRAYALEKYNFEKNVKCSHNLQELSHPVDCIILPLPLAGKGAALNTPLATDSYSINETFDLFSPGQTVIGGKINHSLFEKAGHMGVRLYDYLEREEFNAANAIPSAEGALQAAMRELDVTIHGINALVCGYGRIGKLLARLLRCTGAKVTVSARKFGDLTWADAYGYNTVNTYALSGNVSNFDLIFNTVPHMIFDNALLSQLKNDCLLIDLASKPGGVDFAAAEKLGIRTLWELSLPGRVAPVTAGIIMKRTIYNIIDEWGCK